MNDERFLKDWLRDTTDDTPDAQASADRLLARVPEIRQRSRWWPWLPGRRRPHDETPSSLSGRTRSMLSPVKAITASALIFALGGVLLIAQPFDQEGSVPGAEQATDYPDPVYVTAYYTGGGGNDGEDPPSEPYGPAWLTQWTGTVQHQRSDPRL